MKTQKRKHPVLHSIPQLNNLKCRLVQFHRHIVHLKKQIWKIIFKEFQD